jgi:hypothetical protein
MFMGYVSSWLLVGIPALEHLASADCIEFQTKGGGQVDPPLKGIGERRVAFAHLLEVVAWVHCVGQRGDNIGDDKPPFVVVNGAADFLVLEQGDVGFGIRRGVTHGQSSAAASARQTRTRWTILRKRNESKMGRADGAHAVGFLPVSRNTVVADWIRRVFVAAGSAYSRAVEQN